MLYISEDEICARGPGGIVGVCWRQWRTERALARRGIRFRSTSSKEIAAAYAAMTHDEFDRINGQQDWANWRTIPRALSGNVPDEPLRVLDLGCGTGSSTRVLAHYCPEGSRITGVEIAEPLLAFALRREYRQRGEQIVRVEFVCQGLTEPLKQTDGELVPGASIDLINASGVIGHHLDPESFPVLLAEIARVLTPDGVAMLDAGPTMPGPVLKSVMAAAHFLCLGHYRSWFGDPTGQVVFRRGA